MKKHVKIYLEFFDYSLSEVVESELSGTKATEIHHIDCRGMGGSKEKDFIENLIALNRNEHMKYGDKKQHMLLLYKKHFEFIAKYRPNYEIQYYRIPEPYFTELICINQ